MSGRRFYFVMIAVTILLGIGIILAAFAGDYLLQKQSKKLTALKLESQVLDEQQKLLLKAKQDIAKYSELDREAKAIVPQDKDQAEAVLEIVKIANKNGVNLASVTFPTSSLGQSSPSSSSSQTPSSNSGTKTKTTITQVQPVVGIPGLYNMPIKIQQDTTAPISYGSFIKFLSDLEQNRRTAQVSSIAITPAVNNRSLLSFSLTVNVFIKP